MCDFTLVMSSYVLVNLKKQLKIHIHYTYFEPFFVRILIEYLKLMFKLYKCCISWSKSVKADTATEDCWADNGPGDHQQHPEKVGCLQNAPLKPFNEKFTGKKRKWVLNARIAVNISTMKLLLCQRNILPVHKEKKEWTCCSDILFSRENLIQLFAFLLEIKTL